MIDFQVSCNSHANVLGLLQCLCNPSFTSLYLLLHKIEDSNIYVTMSNGNVYILAVSLCKVISTLIQCMVWIPSKIVYVYILCMFIQFQRLQPDHTKTFSALASMRCADIAQLKRQILATINAISPQIFAASSERLWMLRNDFIYCRTQAIPLAMIQVDYSQPAIWLGLGLIGGGLGLYQLRRVQPILSKDSDIVVSSVLIFSGGILVFQVEH